MAKKRDYVRPSSLGSYFGVGYNDPWTQIKIDMGEIEEDFDDVAQERLDQGIYFEDASLDFFENKFKINILNRNDQVYDFYDGKIRGKIDGMTWLNGEETVVENKISNSNSERFIDKMGYVIQVHCYMLATNTEQALLCGFQNGKPLYRIIRRNEDMITDIKNMTDFIVGYMKGEKTWEQYPLDIMAKYTQKLMLPKIDTLDNEDALLRLDQLRKQKSGIEREIDEIMDSITTKYDAGIYERDGLKVIITPVEGRVSYDWATMSLDHPEIDMTKYMRKSNDYKQVRVTNKRK